MLLRAWGYQTTMKLDFLGTKIICKTCSEIYVPKSLPIELPHCPYCQSRQFEIHDEALDFFLDDVPQSDIDELKLVEEYKTRIAFLLLQLKALNKNEPYQF